MKTTKEELIEMWHTLPKSIVIYDLDSIAFGTIIPQSSFYGKNITKNNKSRRGNNS